MSDRHLRSSLWRLIASPSARLGLAAEQPDPYSGPPRRFASVGQHSRDAMCDGGDRKRVSSENAETNRFKHVRRPASYQRVETIERIAEERSERRKRPLDPLKHQCETRELDIAIAQMQRWGGASWAELEGRKIEFGEDWREYERAVWKAIRRRIAHPAISE